MPVSDDLGAIVKLLIFKGFCGLGARGNNDN